MSHLIAILKLLWQTEESVVSPNSMLQLYKSTACVHWLICMDIKKQRFCYQKHRHNLVKAHVLLQYDLKNIVGVQCLVYVGIEKNSMDDQK